MKKISLFFIFLIGTACVSIQPYKEYALAREALFTAKKFSADKFFLKTYLKARFLYKEGVNFYEQHNYEEAKSSFEDSIKLAEKVEFRARLKVKRQN